MKKIIMKIRKIVKVGLFAIFFIANNFSFAKESIFEKKPVVNKSNTRGTSALCTGPTQNLNLEINNVRARIMNAGDMWWDPGPGVGKYEIPKIDPPGSATSVNSMFAAAIWVGGIDAGNLKLAAMHYRGGFDFFPGPLNADASTDASICSDFDKIWEFKSEDVEAFRSDINADGVINDPIPQSILQWPGKGNTNISFIGNRTLADFYDKDGDGIYSPNNGDYPALKIEHCGDKSIVPDQMLWYVINDKGNLHSETQGNPIGLEVLVSAFAFVSNNEINDMTFYMYKLINRATTDLDSTYMGVWADPDLGWYKDDYIGCDTTRSLGIIYNGDAVDGPGGENYGNQPPIAGIDYFQGPKDENGNLLGMSSFMYFNNVGGPVGDPAIASEYYNILRGIWRDGVPLTYGGTGYDASGAGIPTKYAFPTDPKNTAPGGWSECGDNNPPDDRRFVQSSGPFTLKPGAVNEIIVGVPWVKPLTGTYPCPAFDMLKDADDIAQTLFDNCFDLVKGPPAPRVDIRELDQELILVLSNTDATENYIAVDPALSIKKVDSTFKFQGYKIFQLKDGLINQSDVADISNLQSKAQLLYTVDYKDGIMTATNYKYNPLTKTYDGKVMVNGTDNGIVHTFKITEDAFATSEKQLINFRTYWYLVVPYAYNNWKQFQSDSPNVEAQLIPYIEGTGVKKSGIPHKTLGALTASYGDDLEVVRIEGQGNGGHLLSLSSVTVNEILSSPTHSINNVTYSKGFAPVKAKVIDPLKVKSINFELDIENWISFTTSLAGVSSINLQVGDTVYNTGNTKKAIYYRTAYSIDAAKSDSSGTIAIVMVLGANFVPGENITFENGGSATIDVDGVKMLDAWVLLDRSNSQVIAQSEQYISKGNEQVIVDKRNGESAGISLTLNKVDLPGVNIIENNGAQTSEIIYADQTKKWMTSVKDIDGGANYPEEAPDGSVNFDWIKSGSATGDIQMGGKFIDSLENFESLLNSSWAPYILAARKQSSNQHGPSFNDATGFGTMADLASVEIKFTGDKSKWTKCPVVETGATNLDVPMHSLRGHLSIDQNGNPDGTVNYGHGWFPGYAINMETGERLNIVFGENSRDAENNGDDMLWNPTSTFESSSGLSIGGKHYVYILKTKYDEGAAAWSALASATNVNLTQAQKNALLASVYKEAIWAGMPLVATGYSLLPKGTGIISNDVTIRLRVNKPYQTYYTSGNSMPKYWFGSSLAFDNSPSVRESKLDFINVVPNPYYSYSTYEINNLDNRIRFTNLPDKCDITIYSLDGTMIKKFKRDVSTGNSMDFNALTYEDWDLKNSVGVPISSGVYIIHINAFELGEKTLKWFGIMRPMDLSNF